MIDRLDVPAEFLDIGYSGFFHTLADMTMTREEIGAADR